mgnify:CR=1 FL=1
MHKQFLTLLIDPDGNESLSLKNEICEGDNISSGILYSSKNTYEIIEGIPRFVKSDNYSSNFSFQWNRWPRLQFDKENIGRPMQNWTSNMFKKITEFDPNLMKGKTCIDLGVGSGRFSEICLNAGAIVVGVDNSNSVSNAKKNLGNSENLLIVQADILNLPFKSKTFDYAFSIGVLHHTPEPFKAIKNIYSKLKNGGEFSLSVYEKKSYYDSRPVRFWRYIFRRLRPFLGIFPPLIYSYLIVNIIWHIGKLSKYITYPLRLFFPMAYLPDKKWSILDTFDSLTPTYQSTHTSFEIYQWLKNSNFKNIKPTDWGFTSYNAKK